MKIRGIVEEEASINGDQVNYQVKSEGETFDIVSTDKQAAKDFVFLRRGQTIEVNAVMENEKYISKGSMIDISCICNRL